MDIFRNISTISSEEEEDAYLTPSEESELSPSPQAPSAHQASSADHPSQPSADALEPQPSTSSAPDQPVASVPRAPRKRPLVTRSSPPTLRKRKPQTGLYRDKRLYTRRQVQTSTPLVPEPELLPSPPHVPPPSRPIPRVHCELSPISRPLQNNSSLNRQRVVLGLENLDPELVPFVNYTRRKVNYFNLTQPPAASPLARHRILEEEEEPLSALEISALLPFHEPDMAQLFSPEQLANLKSILQSLKEGEVDNRAGNDSTKNFHKKYPFFDNQCNFTDHLATIEEAFVLENITEDAKKRSLLLGTFESDLKQFLLRHQNKEELNKTYPDMVTFLKEVFPDKFTASMKRKQMDNMKQDRRDSALDYFQKKLARARILGVSEDMDFFESVVSGLSDKELRSKMDDILTPAFELKHFEETLIKFENKIKEQKKEEKEKQTYVSFSSQPRSPRSRTRKFRSKKEQTDSSTGESETTDGGSSSTDSSPRKCYNCGKVGHLAKECRSKKKKGKGKEEKSKEKSKPSTSSHKSSSARAPSPYPRGRKNEDEDEDDSRPTIKHSEN